tara:strand:+ start:794 stop:1153 length:360 start_codon:yes stop_codon:yes gene_type:complete
MASVSQRRPCEYLRFKGSLKTFTIVYTPHFLDRQDERSSEDQPNVLAGLDFDDLFNRATVGQCYALPVVGNLYMYVRRAWHKRRKRWEFELISLTPDNHLTTQNRHFAKPFPESNGDNI